MIQRRTPLKRNTPVKRKRDTPRRGPMRDPDYLRWLKQKTCHISSTFCDGPIDPAHTENNGMRSKGPDSSCVPLCRFHHQQYDAGRKAFEAKWGLDMKVEAAEYCRMYLLWKGKA